MYTIHLYYKRRHLYMYMLRKDFANYKDKALEISPTIVYNSTAVF